MGWRRKRLTKDLIRKYFGRGARIRSRWFADGYKVTTPSGGELLISAKEFTIVIATDDVMHSMTLLGYELWGGITANGSREFIMAQMAHGEALGVNVRPGIKRGWFWRTVMITCVIYGAFAAINGDDDGIILVLFAAWILWLMKRSAKRKLQQLAAEVGFNFPRVHGTAGASSDEDLEREGWV